MKANIRKCGHCGRKFESTFDNNFCQSCIDEGREDSLHINCPRCDHEYDEIDREYLICSRCGYNAENQTTKPGNGIDPDVQLDDWS